MVHTAWKDEVRRAEFLAAECVQQGWRVALAHRVAARICGLVAGLVLVLGIEGVRATPQFGRLLPAAPRLDVSGTVLGAEMGGQRAGNWPGIGGSRSREIRQRLQPCSRWRKGMARRAGCGRKASQERRRSYKVRFVTGYASDVRCVGKNIKHGLTYSGAKPVAGLTAACDRSWLGMWVEVPGIGWRLCEDTGRLVHEGHVDVYMTSYESAKGVYWRE